MQTKSTNVVIFVISVLPLSRMNGYCICYNFLYIIVFVIFIYWYVVTSNINTSISVLQSIIKKSYVKVITFFLVVEYIIFWNNSHSGQLSLQIGALGIHGSKFESYRHILWRLKHDNVLVMLSLVADFFRYIVHAFFIFLNM